MKRFLLLSLALTFVSIGPIGCKTVGSGNTISKGRFPYGASRPQANRQKTKTRHNTIKRAFNTFRR